jgi:hypothetical protein
MAASVCSPKLCDELCDCVPLAGLLEAHLDAGGRADYSVLPPVALLHRFVLALLALALLPLPFFHVLVHRQIPDSLARIFAPASVCHGFREWACPRDHPPAMRSRRNPAS